MHIHIRFSNCSYFVFPGFEKRDVALLWGGAVTASGSLGK
jgi:hypothetical protein